MFLVVAHAYPSLHIEALAQAGLIGGAYIILRIIGRVAGGWVGGATSHSSHTMRRWMGLALLPQAGVAIGMALVAAKTSPELGKTILSVVIGSTVVFEIFGPVLTRRMLVSVGEINLNRSVFNSSWP